MSHLRFWRRRLALALTLSVAALITAAVFSVLAASTIGWQETSTGLPTSNIVRDTEFADVNHDGKPDLITVGNIGVAVYQGNGAGVWAGGVLSFGLPSSGGYGHVAVGDLNNDGHVDIVASAGNGVGVQSWLGNGAGTWNIITFGLPTGTSEGVALADVNQDGRPDVIVAGGAPVFQGVRAYLYQGSSFSETTALTTTGTFNDIAAAYVDNDGYIDVVAAAQSTGLKFWRGNFNANWIYASTGLSTTNNWRGVTFGDIDLDGKLELVAARSNIASATGGGLFAYDYDLIAGTWTLSPNQLPVTASYFKLVLADLNIDGRLDLTAGGGSTFLSQGIYQWLGSIGGFVPTTSPTTTASWERPAVGDFDRDGLLDVGAGAYNGGGARAWRSIGTRDPIGAWTLIASPQITDSPRALWAADYNRDGDTDVIFNRAGGNGLNMYLGDGGNAWTYCSAFNLFGGAYTGTYESVVAAPLDRNSQYPQIAAGRADGGGIQYFGNVTNNCGYFFTFQITTTGSYRGLSAADIDDDTYWQVVAAPFHLLNQGLRLFENGANGWQPQASPVSTGTYCDTAFGDFNNDGKSDIAAAECTPGNGGGLNVFEYWTRGWISHNVSGPGLFYTVAVGDLNNDGQDDLVAAKNNGEQGLYVWTGDGAFNFTPWLSPDVAGEYFDLDLGDVNHDGWLDILAARDGAGVMVWLGDGAGGWTASNTNLPTTGAFFKSVFSHVDHDGNLDIVASGLNQGVQVWTAAEAAPPTINNLQPTTWITLTQSPSVTANVFDTISGISTTGGLYRFSIDGGANWSALLPAAISGSNGSTATQVLSVASVAFGQDSATQNIVELRASDMVGNVGTAQAVIKIDTVPPTAPTSLTSSDHTVNVWSNDNTVSIDWSGATDDTSGLFGYAVLFDQNAGTLPPPVVNAGGTSFNSIALADGAIWYAHVRTHDLAGNWSTTAAHLGPFKIDTTPPTNPANVSSSSHTLGAWSSDPSITMNWSGATDAGSGVSGYSYVFDTVAGTLPDAVVDTFGATATSASLPSGSNKYFHIRTRDAAGNWSGSGVNRGAYWVDVTAPSSSVNSPASTNSTSFTVNWSGSDAHSGIDSYDVQYRNKTTNGAWTTWKSATATTSGTFNGTGGTIYEFRSRARDNVGNLEAYPGTADLTTEVRTIDVYVKNPGIEVNQAVQDLNNSVLLIANKRTFVRCYVQSDAGTINNVNARLRVYRGATLMGTLSPANSGAQINIRTSPDRAQLNDAFYFDVPTGWLNAGSVRFECEVNLPKKYAENDYTNNIRSVTPPNFVNSRPMNIALIDVDYWYNGSVRHVRSVDRTRLAAWLRTAYPINSLTVHYGYLDPPYNSLPNVDTVNSDLAWNKAKRVFGAGETSNWRYYGQAYNIGGFMRGKSVGTPGNVAAGPTGDTSGWDLDGNFGDWYGGHENGHSYGRAHVQGAPYAGSGACGDEAGPDGSYPYNQGRMSPQTTMWTNSTLYGVDWSLATPAIIPPTWYDVMTYCPGQWISDYTYEAIYNRMNTEPVLLKESALAGEHLGVFGSIISATNTVTLSTFYRVPNGSDVFGRDVNGTHHIKLLNAGNGVLADYNFSPRGAVEPDEPTQAIMEFVPWVTGTQSIVIANANGQPIYTRTVSSNTPTVTLQAPAGGITLTGSSVIVSWAAMDVDNDELTFSLDYSTDGGATWNPLSAQVPSTTVSINLNQLPGSPTGKFRVWVSDGVNTAYAETNGTFAVANKAPQINAVSPVSGTTYVLSQTVAFEVEAYDIEDGVPPDDHITWTSDLDGVLGTGALLQIDMLSLGTHTITLSVHDNQNATTTTTLVVTVGPEDQAGSIAPDVFLPIVMK